MTRTLVVVVGLRTEARIAAAPGVHVVVGGGRNAELAATLEAVLASTPNPAVLSFGVAGALSPRLAVGEVIVPDEIATPDGPRVAADVDWSVRIRAATGGSVGVILGLDAVLGSTAAKARMWGRWGAVAVDMESHVAARAAAKCDAPFAALRVISDSAGSTLPRAAAAGMRTDGGVDVLAVLRRLMIAPGELPGLIRTGVDAGTAFRKLKQARRSVGRKFARDEI